MKEENCVTALLTGRNTNFKDIISKIVSHAELEFQLMGFKPADSVGI